MRFQVGCSRRAIGVQMGIDRHLTGCWLWYECLDGLLGLVVGGGGVESLWFRSMMVIFCWLSLAAILVQCTDRVVVQ